MDILVTVEGQKMKIATNQRRHIEGSKQFVRFRFDLSEEWRDMIIFANFVQGNVLYPVQLDSTACAYLPSEVKEGNCLLVLYGGTSGKQTSENDAGSVIKATTEPLFLDIGKDVTAQKVPELVTDTEQSNYERMLKELKEGILANKVFNDAITDAVNSLNDSAVAQEIIENKNAVTAMRNELLGDGGTNSSPGNDSTLDRINKSYNEIIGLGKTYNFPADNSALKEIRNAKEQIVGKDNTDTAGSPDEASALGQINKMYDEVIGENGDYTEPIDNTALSEIRSAKTEILGANTNNNAASPADTSALGQINKAYDEIIGTNSDNSYNNPANNTVLKEIRDTKTELIGLMGTAADPISDSTLDRINKMYDEVVGENNTYEVPADNTALKEIRSAKNEILGESASDNASSPADSSALGQVNKMYKEVIGAGKTYIEPADSTALKEIRSAKNEILGAGANDNAASPADASALGQIKNSHNQILGENGSAENPITGSALEQILTAKSETLNAHDTVIGNSGTVDDPKAGSALAEARKSESAAKASAELAKGYAEIANHGINVIDSLDNSSGTDALSAKQGKLLNEQKLDLSGGTMTGDLTLKGDPTESNMAATKSYVDNHLPRDASADQNGLMSSEDYTKLQNVYSQLNGLKFVIATEAPTDADDNTITIVLAN